METLNQIRHGVQHGLEALSEGWLALRQRAGHAITHFLPGNNTNSATEKLAANCSRWGLLPMELREEADRIVVNLEAPGMSPEDFNIEVAGDILTIRGEKRFESLESEAGRWFLLERAYGRFERSVHLPADVDENLVDAKYRRGVLAISLPKKNRRLARKVTISAS